MAKRILLILEDSNRFLSAVTNASFENDKTLDFLTDNIPSDGAFLAGIINCVDGKPYISNAFNDMCNKMKSSKMEISLQSVILSDRYYDKRIEAYFYFSNPASSKPGIAKLIIQRDGILLAGTAVAHFHINTMFNLIRDYFIKRDKIWTASKMEHIKERAGGDNVGLISRLIYEVAIGRRPKIKKSSTGSTISDCKIKNEKLITDTVASKDAKLPSYSNIILERSRNVEKSDVEEVISKELSDDGDILSNVSDLYGAYNLLVAGNCTAKSAINECYEFSRLTQLGIFDVVDSKVIWKNDKLKQMYDTKNALIIKYFKESDGWRLSEYSLHNAVVSFELVTMNNCTHKLSFGGDSEVAMRNLMALLKANGLLSELYRRLAKYVTEEMKVDLSEQLLDTKEIKSTRERNLSIRDLLSNI